MAINDDLRDFFLNKELIKKPEDIENSESLLEKGIIDSVVIQDVIDFIEEKYGITVDDDDMMPENFDSLTAIENYVNEKRNGS